MNRRTFLATTAGGSLLLTGCDSLQSLQKKLTQHPAEQQPHTSDAAQRTAPADVTLRIAPVIVDIAKDHAISTTGYTTLKQGWPREVGLNCAVPTSEERINEDLGLPAPVGKFKSETWRFRSNCSRSAQMILGG
jgi:hypothetical protein